MFESNPHAPRRLRSRTAIAAALALALLAAACGEDDPITAPTTSPATTSIATTTSDAPPTTTTAPAAEPEPEGEPSTSATTAPDPSEGAAPSNGSPGGEPLWSDVFDGSSASAQACIRESLGEADLDAVLARPVTSDDFPTDDDMSILACIGPEHARDVVLSGLVWSMQTETGIMIGAEETACLRESMAGIDVIGMVESSDDLGAIALLGAFGRCLGDAFISLMLVDSGVDFEDLSDGEKACLRERQAGVDWDGFTGDPEASFEAFLDLSLGMFECLPELGFDTAPPELVETPPGVDDDHADSSAGATSAEVGEAVQGTLHYGNDVDFFVFDAVEGERYELNVEPGTLEDPTLALYDADGTWLDGDDDSGGSLAPLVYWEAPSAGAVYVEVGGFGAGSYTLMIAVSDVDDDHADSLEGATAARVGEAFLGTLNYGGDVDYFVFDAVEGEVYQIDVEPGTLEDPTLALYDADGWQLDYDDDSGDSLAPRLLWPTSSSGPLYVEVGGYGAGTYTLTIAHW